MIPVFYDPRQSVPGHKSYSPSAGKPAKVVEDWLRRFPNGIKIMPVEPVKPTELAEVHDPGYVRKVLTGKYVNGFGDRDPRVAEACLWTTGSFLSATRYALEHGGIVASPTSGFHHAGRDYGGGFCTFNGLALAAVRATKDAGRVVILDADMHYGDGTDDILATQWMRSNDFVRYITHRTVGDEKWGAGTSNLFLSQLGPWLRDNLHRGDILLYQAGADPHIDDPLGGFLTTEQLARRDAIVFDTAMEKGVPVVWNLAGGYQKDFAKVLEIHANTMRAAIHAVKPA